MSKEPRKIRQIPPKAGCLLVCPLAWFMLVQPTQREQVPWKTRILTVGSVASRKAHSPGCDQQVSVTEINLESGWGNCRGCRTTFPLADAGLSLASVGFCCPLCGQLIPSADICLRSGWGRCAGCQEVFALSDFVGEASQESPQQDREEPVQRSKNVAASIHRTDGELVVHRPVQGINVENGLLMLLTLTAFVLAAIAT